MIRDVQYLSSDPDLDFFPIPDPGVKKAPDPWSGSSGGQKDDPVFIPDLFLLAAAAEVADTTGGTTPVWLLDTGNNKTFIKNSLWEKKQCCGSGMFIPDPDFYPSRIQKQQQKREEKKN
jgi:hypothetical protein